MISPQQAWAVATALWAEAAADARAGGERTIQHAWALLQQHPTLGAFFGVHGSDPAAQWLALAAVGLTGVAVMIVAGLLLWLLQRRLRRLLRRGQQRGVEEEEEARARAPGTSGAAVADAARSVGWPLQTVTPEKAMAARYCTALHFHGTAASGVLCVRRVVLSREREIALKGEMSLARSGDGKTLVIESSRPTP